MEKELIKISKYLSLILRHDPRRIGLKLDKNGWANINSLIAKTIATGQSITYDQLIETVKTNNKKRFEIDITGYKIRACQGHSINIDLNLVPIPPPDELFHGTTIKFIKQIKKNGLKNMERQYIHLSTDIKIANNVGKRHGKPIIIIIDSKRMYKNGYKFYLSKNKVWLTKKIPKEYFKYISYAIKI